MELCFQDDTYAYTEFVYVAHEESVLIGEAIDVPKTFKHFLIN